MSKRLAIECDVETGQQVVYVPQGYTLQRNYVGAYVLTPDAAPATEPKPNYERWTPNGGQSYRYIDSLGDVFAFVWAKNSPEGSVDRRHRDYGNCFPDEATAKRAARWVRANFRLRELARTIREGAEVEDRRWYVRLEKGVVAADWCRNDWSMSGAAHFATRESARRAIEIMTAEGLLDDLFLAP
jgi:hypothetical protein